MTLILRYHPLSSFSQKALIALYENDTPFRGEAVRFEQSESRARLLELWPMGKIPVLHDTARDRTAPETSLIIEYLDTHYPGPVRLLPDDPETRFETRLWDRIIDNYVMVPMQKIVTDRLRAAGENDPHGVADARATLATAYTLLDERMEGRHWAAGEAFTLADCAAAPALFYAGIVAPFTESHPYLAAYFERLLERPSYARALAEARPYLKFFPYKDAVPERFLAGEK